MLRLVATSPYSRLPVYRGSLDRVIGILHTKDVVLDYISDQPRASIAALLRPILRVRETMPADRLLAFLRERRSHHALVEDDDGRISGLITLEDVVGELLGGVSDEFKVGAAARDPAVRTGASGCPARCASIRPRRCSARGAAAPRRSRRTSSPRSAACRNRASASIVDGVEVEIEVVEAGNIASVIVGAPDPASERAA